MYHSNQHTKCALCGIDKHTPLRTWDGYICLTCIDKLLHEQHDIIESFKESKEKIMGQIPPPRPLSKEELNERIKNGAKTMKEIDPALYEYCRQGEHFRKFAIIIFSIAGVVTLATAISIMIRRI